MFSSVFLPSTVWRGGIVVYLILVLDRDRDTIFVTTLLFNDYGHIDEH